MSREHQIELGFLGLMIFTFALLAWSDWIESARPNGRTNRVLSLHQPFWLSVLEWIAVIAAMSFFALPTYATALAAVVVVTCSMLLWTHRPPVSLGSGDTPD